MKSPYYPYAFLSLVAIAIMSELGEAPSILLDNKSDWLLLNENVLDGDLAFVSKIVQYLSPTR